MLALPKFSDAWKNIAYPAKHPFRAAIVLVVGCLVYLLGRRVLTEAPSIAIAPIGSSKISLTYQGDKRLYLHLLRMGDDPPQDMHDTTLFSKTPFDIRFDGATDRVLNSLVPGGAPRAVPLVACVKDSLDRSFTQRFVLHYAMYPSGEKYMSTETLGEPTTGCQLEDSH